MNRKEIRNAIWLPEHKLRSHHKKLIELISDESNLYNLTQMSKILGKAISTISEHLKNLEYSGYIIIDSDGLSNFCKLTEKGKSILRSIRNNTEIIDRGHDILFTFPIQRTSKKWSMGKFVTNKSMKNWSEQLTSGQGSNKTIQINGKSSITVLVKEVFASASEMAILRAYEIAERQILDLVSKNPGLVVGRECNGYVFVAKLSRQSHAIPNDCFAKYCFKIKRHIKGKETNGRFEVDASHGTPEIEFVDKKLAQGDYKKYVKFVEMIINGRIDPDKLEILCNSLPLNNKKE